MSQDGQPNVQDPLVAAPPMPTVPPTELHRGSPRLLRSSDVRHSIGWQVHRAVGPCFVVVRLTKFAAIKVLSRFPLAPDGWESAWQALEALDTDAAKAVSATLATMTARQMAERQSDALDGDTVARLRSATYDGGSSVAQLIKGQTYDLRFRADRLTIFKPGTVSALTELPYPHVDAIDVEASGHSRSASETIAVTSAVALAGALVGFLVTGLRGLFVGALLCGLITALVAAGTTRAKTIVRVLTRDSEFFFSQADNTPEAIRIALSQPRLAIAGARVSSPASAGEPRQTSATATDQLRKLASLLADGLLSREEFEQLKARIIAQS